MFLILYKLILSFLLPPGIFILIFFITGGLIFYFNKEKLYKFKIIGIVLIGTGTILYLFSIEPIKDLVVMPLENIYAPIKYKDLENADSIIMLGGGIIDNAPLSFGEKGIPSYSALARINEVIRVYNKTNKKLKILLSGGSVYGNTEPEAKLYRRYLISLGVNGNDILIDDKSRTTYENVINLKKLLKLNKFQHPILITSATHMPRSVYTFKKNQIDVIPDNCDYITRRAGYQFSSFFPSALNIEYMRRGVWEYIGIVYYKIKGF
ncbi:YdcF family protein [Haliovirga abyssi]|uniref:DUF218 domain-containing protein n=1 Tax=Haliovirga abyssi TaxID=2996794 RepID=A0AAU9DEP7_9FUSO|nr:YdcF family protein [Haliovirga abyssi]BDU50663.1 hypothetical protein HLVA_12320 [Haliovirga abyssi]